MATGDVVCNLTNPLAKRCAVFDGVDDYVDITHKDDMLGANLSNGFSISADVFLKSNGELDTGYIIDKSTGTNGQNGFRFHFALPDTIAFKINNGTGRSSGSISLNTWFNIIVTVTAGQLCSFYVNGVLSGTANQDLVQGISTITTTTNARIGNRAGNTDRTWDGGIRNVCFYNKVLSSAEILKVGTGQNVKSGLIHRWKLDTDYNDSVGSADGTNSGSVLRAVDDQVATALSDTRTTANDKYLIAVTNNKVLTTVIEEAP